MMHAISRECAVRVALAYLYAFMLAMLDHIERVTGRRDYGDFRPVWPEHDVAQQIWRADSTIKQMREVLDDADLMRQLAGTRLGPIAEDYGARLLAECMRESN